MRQAASVAKSKADRKWLASWQDLSLYGEESTFGYYQWGMQLWKRAEIQSSPDGPLRERHYAALEGCPLSLGRYDMSIPLRSAVQDVNHLDVERLAGLLASPGFKGLIDSWTERFGLIPPHARALNSIFLPEYSSSPGIHAVHGVQVHPLAVEVTSEGGGELPAGNGWVLETAFVGVDLSQRDSVLIDGFKKWLRQRREHLSRAELVPAGIPRETSGKGGGVALKLTPAVLSKWHAMRVLAYIDIGLRAKFEGRKKPTASVIGEHLYPGQFNTEAKVRQQLAPLAKQLLKRSSYQRLLSEGVAALLTPSTNGYE